MTPSVTPNAIETGLFELHVFVAPLNPEPSVQEQFRLACEKNGQFTKALVIALDFVGRGYISVPQTSRYVTTSFEQAKAAIHQDAEHFRAMGFEVIREKIEAMADNPLVPLAPNDYLSKPPSDCFEFHILFSQPENANAALSPIDESPLREVSRALSRELGRPVPLSYNLLKPHLRFLNIRGYNTELKSMEAIAEKIVEKTAPLSQWRWLKTIEEYVCFDTNKQLDAGWLEPVNS